MKVNEKLHSFTGSSAFAHVEVTPGGFCRNIQLQITDTFVHGDGPYRVSIKLPNRGWIRVEGITHYEIDDKGRLLLAGHDELGRLTTALQLSSEAFE
jgi:hypothetical protein